MIPAGIAILRHYALRHEGFKSPLAQRLLAWFVPE